MFICMYVCTKSFLKTTTNSSCVCTHLANKADSDSDSSSSRPMLIYSPAGLFGRFDDMIGQNACQSNSQ